MFAGMVSDKPQPSAPQFAATPKPTLLPARLLAHRLIDRVRISTAFLLRKLPLSRSVLGLPHGRISSIRKWVAESRGKLVWDERRTGSHYRRVRRAVRARTNSAPHSVVADDLPPGVWLREYEVHPELFLATLRNARVLGPSGVVITPDNKIVEESAWTGERWLERDRVVRALSLPKPELLAGHYFTIASFSAEGYAHWILDALPRLSLLRYATPHAKIIVSNLTTSWQRDSLSRLGIDLSDLVVLDHRHVQLEFLHLPSYIGQPGRIHPFAVSWLRKHFLEGEPTAEPGRRLYLTRSSGRRRVLNEEELGPVLNRFGFEIINPGTLSFQQQIDLFSRAAAIVSPHGAGLTNCVFAPKTCRVFELFARTCVRPMYYQLSNMIGQTYWYLVAGESKSTAQTDSGFDDIRVDPHEFEQTMADMFSE